MYEKSTSETFPQWLEIVPESDNIATIFEKATCYISASYYETVSMAIAEASIWGLPIIESDIIGTSWNRNNPSTFLFEAGNVEMLAEKRKYF